MTPQTKESITLAKEIADTLQDFSSDRIAWLALRSSFQNLADWSPEAIILAELIARACPGLEGSTITATGWITAEGELIEYT